MKRKMEKTEKDPDLRKKKGISRVWQRSSSKVKCPSSEISKNTLVG